MLKIDNEKKYFNKEMGMNFFEKNRTFFWVEGIILIVLGFLAVALPQISTLAIELFLGWLFLVGGIFQAIRAFISISTFGFWPSIIGAVCSIGIGALLIAYPLSGILTLTLLLTIYYVIEGFTKIFLSMLHQEVANWGWLTFSGIVSLILAAIIFSGWPGTATWVIGLLVGINMIFLGFTLISLTASEKKV
jgi:uncharacterized membrane protein HdeD (DUF308 family)